MNENKFQMLEVLEDVVTGLQGVCMAISFYSTGCTHYGLCSRELKDGKMQDWEWFDESRLRQVTPPLVIELNQPKVTGEPRQIKRTSGSCQYPPEM